MSERTLYRWAATALLVGAVATVVGFVAHPPGEPAAMATPTWVWTHVLLWIGALAILPGLLGLYLHQREQLGRVSAAATALAGVGLLALSAAYALEGLVLPVLVAEAPAVIQDFPLAPEWTAYRVGVAVSGVALAAGFALFGVAMYRAAVLPRWPAALATLGAVVAAVQFLLPRPLAVTAVVAFCLGLTGLGAGLWRSVPTPASDARLAGRH